MENGNLKTILEKSAQSNTPKRKADYWTLRSIPVSEAYLEDLADRLRIWACENEDAIVFGDFLNLEQIDYKSLQGWMARNEKLRDMVTYAKQMMGARRERKALLGQIAYNPYRDKQIAYDDEAKDIEVWRLKQKIEALQEQAKLAAADVNANKQIVVIERFKEKDEEVVK